MRKPLIIKTVNQTQMKKIILILFFISLITGCSTKKYLPAKEIVKHDITERLLPNYSFELISLSTGNKGLQEFQLVENHSHLSYSYKGNEEYYKKYVDSNTFIFAGIYTGLCALGMAGYGYLFFTEIGKLYYLSIPVGIACAAPWIFPRKTFTGKMINIERQPANVLSEICPITKEVRKVIQIEVFCNGKTGLIETDQNGRFKIDLIKFFDLNFKNTDQSYDLKIESSQTRINQNIKIFPLNNLPHIENYVPETGNSYSSTKSGDISESVFWDIDFRNVRNKDSKVYYYQAQPLKKKVNYLKNNNNQRLLRNIVMSNNENKKLTIEAYRLLDKNSLYLLNYQKENPAVSIASEISLGLSSWQDKFRQADLDTTVAHNIIQASMFVKNPTIFAYDIKDFCYRNIKRGNIVMKNILINLLNNFGDVELATLYLNCNYRPLEEAAAKWGSNHGYRQVNIKTTKKAIWGDE